MYEQETNGIIVRAEPAYLEAESAPEASRYVWAYTIEIENRSAEIVQLLHRHWRITDLNGLIQEVHGEGVIGQQPVIEPGEAFRYTSACPLDTPNGWMAGAYEMIALDRGEPFLVAIPPFALDSPHAERLAN